MALLQETNIGPCLCTIIVCILIVFVQGYIAFVTYNIITLEYSYLSCIAILLL